MMKNGLPSLLDAIFGKKDLASVSLDELYEVVNEFPSFNAAHFLLSKKLKEQNDSAYEKVSLRTALYFNNPFWLQSILEEGNRIKKESVLNSFKQVREITTDDDKPGVIVSDVRVDESEEVNSFEETIYIQTEFKNPENFNVPVTSFDELISKYNIEPVEQFNDAAEFLSVPQPTLEIQTVSISETPADIVFPKAELFQAPIPEENTNLFETREEVLNEYGIFEEVLYKKADLDMDAFDRPIEKKAEAGDDFPVENPVLALAESRIEIYPEVGIPDEPIEKSIEGDYEAFDRPIEKPQQIETTVESVPFIDFSTEAESYDADDTEESGTPFEEQDDDMHNEMQILTARFNEQQKSATAFDPKKAESIVFAPYHMIDYFASQGIKLVLEDNPPDSLGRQLKSFTDWLKVMKKLPVRPLSMKTEEKEADRIRHFAAHSIEERDILTESMAEVLIKQGMYENAISLYQKLSLIYPPKRAYFASRIEQIKAFLP